ncbi:lipoprotein [Enterococcus caccae]|nr:lipoprotein [Enterococcus caccae]
MLFWYVFPVIVLFACNFIITTFSLTERFKIKAPDISIPFLFIGLNELSKDSYGQSIVPYMVISVLLLGICVAVFQAYYYGEILYGRYFKMFWRLVFLLSFILYGALVLLNIVHYFS